MKKIVSFALLVMIMLTLSACSNKEFTLRNGIKFGDTKEEVLTKETTLTRESEDSFTFEGKIAGYSDAECWFGFDNDGKLTSMLYNFGSDICTSKNETNNVYEKLFDSLKRQYGTPLGNTDGNWHLITGEAIAIYSTLKEILEENMDYIKYDEWVVDCDDYHVKIDLISYYDGLEIINLFNYTVRLSYYYYTDEDYDAAVREKEEGHKEQEDL